MQNMESKRSSGALLRQSSARHLPTGRLVTNTSAPRSWIEPLTDSFRCSGDRLENLGCFLSPFIMWVIIRTQRWVHLESHTSAVLQLFVRIDMGEQNAKKMLVEKKTCAELTDSQIYTNQLTLIA